MKISFILYPSAWFWHWLAIGLAIPLALFQPASWWLVLFLLLAAWLARGIGRGRWWTRTPLDWPLILLTVAGSVSYLAAAFLAREWGEPLVRLLIFWLGLALFQGLVCWRQDGGSLPVAWSVFAGAGAVVALLGLFGGTLPAKLPVIDALAQSIPQLFSGLQGAEAGFHPNQVAGTLLWFLPVPLALRHIPLGALAAAITLAFLLMQSRGALLGALVASILLLLWGGKWGRYAFFLILLLAAIGLTQVSLLDIRNFLAAQMAQEATGVFEPEFRAKLWRAAFQATTDFAFTGMGLGMFRRLGPWLYAFPIRPADVAHAHNFFLHTGAELGIPGLLATLALWLGTAGLLVKRLKNNAAYRPFLLAALWSLLAFTIYGLTDTVALGSKPSLVWWAYLGLVAATHERSNL